MIYMIFDDDDDDDDETDLQNTYIAKNPKKSLVYKFCNKNFQKM